MSINFCSISENALDGFCGRARAKVLPRLIAEKQAINPAPPPINNPSGGSSAFGGTSPGWGRSVPLQPGIPHVRPPQYTPPYRPDISRDLPAYEQPTITVTVSNFLGLNGTESLNAVPQVEFVTATNFEMGFVTVSNLEFGDDSNADITVNITGLEI